MPYSHTTYAQLKTELALRLSDPGKVFWKDAELGVYIVESLRTWQAFSGYWRGRALFSTSANVPFYDIADPATALTPALRSATVLDTDVVSACLYHLMEPPILTLWTGSDMFTLVDVVNAVQRRRNQFLLETGVVISRTTQVLSGVPGGRVPLADSIIDVIRGAWTTPAGVTTPLQKGDEWEFRAFSRGWNLAPSTPLQFSIAAAPPLTVQLAPPPADAGTLDLLSVQTGVPLGGGLALGIPNDFVWVVKWGALADLLGKDGQARDPQRAAYCEKRWQQGIQLARISTSVVDAYINDSQVFVESVAALDKYKTSWQNTQGTPTVLALAGLNIVALSDVPDGVYSVTLDVVENAPVPVLDEDQVQIGREHLDMLLDYSEHLAAFKMEGQEFEVTAAHMDRMIRLAAQQNVRLRSAAGFADVLANRAQAQEALVPVRGGALQNA